jgi:hypothetical protein
MSTKLVGDLEQRMTVMEQELAQLKQQLQASQPQQPPPRWKGIIGVFKDDSLFDQAEQLGREWREAQQMEYEDDADTPA